MTIQEIRNLTGLSQSAFGNYYNIPVSTIKKWESSPDSPNYRKCPVYMRQLLEKAVRTDFQNHPTQNHRTIACSEQEADYIDPLYQVGTNWILCGSSALQFMEYFVGHINGSIYVYSLDPSITPSEGYICIEPPSTIEFSIKDGIKYTTFNQTINDMLSNNLLEDPQAIMEALEEFSYRHPDKQLQIELGNVDKFNYYHSIITD